MRNTLRTAYVAAMAIVFAGLMPAAWSQHRDLGVNQPGAVGNYGGAARQTRTVYDPGINQPGRVGNVPRDPGVNQPGAYGNVHRDVGVNQPGAYGNYGGAARQTRTVYDPGINQPGYAGNVRRY